MPTRTTGVANFAHGEIAVRSAILFVWRRVSVRSIKRGMAEDKEALLRHYREMREEFFSAIDGSHVWIGGSDEGGVGAAAAR